MTFFAFVENRDVPAARNGDSQRLLLALGSEILVQAFAQEARIITDNIVLSGIVGYGTSESVNADLVLGDLGGPSAEFPVTDIQQEIDQK